jgi:hypothetical protein
MLCAGTRSDPFQATIPYLEKINNEASPHAGENNLRAHFKSYFNLRAHCKRVFHTSSPRCISFAFNPRTPNKRSPAFVIEVCVTAGSAFVHHSAATCFTVIRRYSDFVDLLRLLRASHQPAPVAAEAAVLPPLPPKRVNVGRDADDLKLVADGRRTQLEEFVHALLRSHACMATSPAAAFFDLVCNLDNTSLSSSAAATRTESSSALSKPLLHAAIQSVRLFPAISIQTDLLPVVLCVHGFRSSKDSW